jgi:hypothetical protein
MVELMANKDEQPELNPGCVDGSANRVFRFRGMTLIPPGGYAEGVRFDKYRNLSNRKTMTIEESSQPTEKSTYIINSSNRKEKIR